MEAKHTDYQKLKQRNQSLKREAGRLGETNAKVENKISSITKEVARLRALNVELSQKVEEELLKQAGFTEQLERIEAQVIELEKSYSAQRTKYLEASRETERLERELEKLEAKRNAYIKYSKRAMGTQAALEMRKEQITEKVVKADTELKSWQTKRPEQAKRTLQDRVRRLSGKDLKSGAILYNCLSSIIANIEENEFEGVTYKTRINKNKSKIGGRLYFENVSSQYSDFCENLRPVVLKLGKQFKAHGIEITTRAKRSPAGIVSAVDVTVVVNLALRKEVSPSA